MLESKTLKISFLHKHTILLIQLSIFFMLICINKTYADGEIETQFTNTGGIINTRHNLTQSTMQSGGSTFMDRSRNNYGEVCVYCHTPHGANTKVAAPLWNRTANNTVYTTYDQGLSQTFTGSVSNPGVNSITCLSCHDGTLGVDSIVNMPGSGNYTQLT